MKKILIVIFICSLFVSLNSVAQDVHFSQFTQTPQLINPAATGVFGGKFRAIANYRTQWGALGNAYNTYAASFDFPVMKKARSSQAYLGVGGNFYKDVAGSSEFGNFLGALSVSGVLPVSKSSSFSLGLQLGIGQYSVKLNSLTWGNQFDGQKFDSEINSFENLGAQSASYVDLGSGLMYEYRNKSSSFIGGSVSWINAGVSIYHLNKPKQKFVGVEEEIPMKAIIQTSGSVNTGESRLSLLPSVFYTFQGPSSEFTLGLLFQIKSKSGGTKYSGLFKESSFAFGAHYRAGDAIIPSLTFEFTDYMIGVSYDYGTSDLANATGGLGGIEISLRYVNKPKALQRSSF